MVVSLRLRNAALFAAVSLSCLCAQTALADPAPGGKNAQFHKYVALGDSYAAAPGVDPVDGASGSCSRSLRNYPSQVAEALGLERGESFIDESCSGTSSYGITGGESGPLGDSRAPQLDAVTPDTDLVTLTVGANNDGLAQAVFFECNIGGGGCEQKVQAKPQLADMNDFSARLEGSVADTLRQIHQIAPKATVEVVGYIRVGSAWCPAWGPYNAQDAAYIDGVQGTLNNALKKAAAQTGSKYVDAAAAAAGHGVCSDTPWVTGGGALLGSDISLHPLAEGEDGMAKAVLASLGR
ncbi:GDSL family lipase [Segniliparus rotundus DSM 44985]|uniref:GDSL family lipase n=1 Tax=Segniliparus rotundus (strain ATCC BAA-972 / CDC 1076 / CIP 108378 / DSM 44985 / JCM 13578) TaxID=640132 RepID=D6Z9B0_SEGRD|nr:SGNH/GDSL hydrolase family protein [Segniliparus rotundus]ADG98540.1 GDSL family lipase [Segniliparus rotundus DSM 44985]